MDCIDLKATFGHKYRIDRDEAHAAEYGDGSRIHDPWLLTIPARHGHFYPHGGNRLAFSTTGRGPKAKAISGLDCVEVVQDGGDGLTVTFDLKDFPTVAKLAKPKTRRKLSPEHKAKLLAAAKPFAKGNQFRASKAQENALEPRRAG